VGEYRTVPTGKKLLRFLILAVLVVLLALTLTGTALAADRWTDISDAQWIATYNITAGQAATVAEGYDDGTFRPGLSVTRAQFAKMTVDGLGLPTMTPALPTFIDVPPNHFFYRWIEGGVDAGLISGFVDGTFRPNSGVTRQQAASILGLYLAQKELGLRGHIAGEEDNYPSLEAWYLAEGSDMLAEFADAGSVSPVHLAPTAYLAFHGVLQGAPRMGGIYLSPGSNLTRAQAVALILRVEAVSFSTALPTVTLLNPSSGPVAGGNAVVVTGTNFTGATVVRFGSIKAGSFIVDSATQITAVAPAGTAGTVVDVTVTTPAGTSAAGAATKYGYGVPTVTAVNPAAGPATGGNNVVITGTNFVGVTTVKFGNVAAGSFAINSTTQITAVAPAGMSGTTVDVTVTTAAGTSATSMAGKYSYGIPTVTALNPAAGPPAGGNSVVITGTGFTGLSGSSAVKFGTKDATSYVVDSPTQITAVAPSGTNGTTVDVTVTNPIGTSVTSGLGNDYSYGIPTVTALNPAAGPPAGGNSVVITGTGFTGLSGASAVKFGTKNALSYVVNSPTQITAAAPSGTNGTTVQVVVTNPVGSSATSGTGNDYIYGAPTVTALIPNGGPVAGGNSVTIIGSGFVSGSTVAFGTGAGSAATSVVVVDSTTITAAAPAHIAGVVDVTVTTAAGTSLTTGSGNDYAYGEPTITSLSPVGGPVTGGTSVTITGTGFVPGATVAFGTGIGSAGTDVVVVSPTQITVTSPSHAMGMVEVTVTTPGGKSSITGTGNDFTYGLAKFAVTMSGGTTPLSAVDKTAGTPFQVRVTAQDAVGNTVTDFTGTVELASNAFDGIVNAVIASNGYVDNIEITPSIAGTDRHISASWDTTIVTPNASGNFTVNPGEAAELIFGVEPSDTVAGMAITPAVTVRIEDGYGNLVDDDTTSVTLAIDNNAGPGGTLSGTTSVTASNGVATFSNLSIDVAGTGYTLEATATGLAPAVSDPFNIT